MKHYSHIIRFCILLVIIGIAFFAVRSYLLPDSFGVYGSYTYGYHRGDSDREQAALPALFQGSEKCRSCHETEYIVWSRADHNSVSCEACHGYWQAHNGTTFEKTVLKDTGSEACLLCHEQLSARPAAFPQVQDLASHMNEQEQEIDENMTCIFCHHPHEPL